MVIIVKRLVPVYKKSDPVPRKWLNLRKAVHVTSFKHLYPNITQILVSQYGLLPEEKIVVFWTKELSLPHFARYRVNFRKVYSGRLSEFTEHAKQITTGSME
jgi:hypothetical protein